ncbi:MAG: T9SS type A sorting domain-containing protein [Cyclonatronaceae bacterium]
MAGNGCEMYDPMPLSRGFGGQWIAPQDEQSASFYVPASRRGGGIITATLSAGSEEISPRLRVCQDSSCVRGSIVGDTGIEVNEATVKFQAAGGQGYHFDILQFGNAPEDDYPVGYSLSVSYEDRIDCWEINNTVEQAKQLNVGDTINAYMIEGYKMNFLQSSEYADWYTFELEEEAFIEINMPQPAGMHLMRVKLFDEPDENVATVQLDGKQENKGQPFIATTTRARAPGTYYLRVGVLLSGDGVVSGPGDQPDHWNQKYEMSVTVNTVTSTGDDKPAPENFVLSQNYPNPFNPSTTIEFTLPQAETVRLEVFNSIGKRVALLIDKQLPAGSHSISFDASDLPSGIYIYRIEAGRLAKHKKLTLIK